MVVISCHFMSFQVISCHFMSFPHENIIGGNFPSAAQWLLPQLVQNLPLLERHIALASRI